MKRLDCTWGWKSWNERADGTGSSYGNKASVKNLRATTGTTNLYAQWDEGYVELPDPGTKSDCTFKGWYDAPSGGSLIGKTGDRVYVASSTTYYARWQPYARIAYYADGADGAVFSESVEAGCAYPVEQPGDGPGDEGRIARVSTAGTSTPRAPGPSPKARSCPRRVSRCTDATA